MSRSDDGGRGDALSRTQRSAAVGRLVDALRAAQTATDMMDEAFCDFLGINRTDGRCLDVVERRGRVTPGELARDLRLTTGAVTAMVDRLVAAKLLRRSPDPDDRRKVVVELTTEASRLTREIYGELARVSAPFLEALTDDEILTMISFFETSREINSQMAESVRSLVPRRKASLRYRLEQAKALKDDAKNLVRDLATELKGRVEVVIVSGDSRWVRRGGRWVQAADDPAPEES